MCDICEQGFVYKRDVVSHKRLDNYYYEKPFLKVKINDQKYV